jgi:hypothetical protein
MAFLVALIAGIKTSIGIFISDLCLSCLNPKSVSWAFKLFFLLLISSSGCWSVLQKLNSIWVIFLLVLIALNSISRSMFKNNAGVERHTLWSEFYAQLSEEKKTAYSQTSREKNRITKEALDNDFTNKFNKWIYETKIKQ